MLDRSVCQPLHAARRTMRTITGALALACAVFAVVSASGRPSPPQTNLLRLDSMSGLQTLNTKAEIVSYRGRKALRLSPPQNHDPERESMFALVDGSDFKDGTIEVDVVGLPITAMD